MDDTELTLIYTTFPDVESARRVGGDLVSNGLAACTNILPGMISVFAWDGKIAEEGEVAMIIKTRSALVTAVTDAVIEKHPYDEPAVVALPVSGGSKSFLDWIRDSTVAA